MSLENILPITFFPYIGRFIIRRKQAVFYFVHRICSLLIRVTKLVKHRKRKKGLTPEFHIVSLKLSNIFSMTHKRNIPANIHSGMKYSIILLWSLSNCTYKAKLYICSHHPERVCCSSCRRSRLLVSFRAWSGFLWMMNCRLAVFRAPPGLIACMDKRNTKTMVFSNQFFISF